MEQLSWNNKSFLKDGTPCNLVCGEFPYFRVPRESWKTRLRLWKDAGGNAISTYIPWLIHEPEEGQFFFSTNHYNDLSGFLECCREEGMPVIVRPGPYQYSELVAHGLPCWLTRDYPQILARRLDGSVFSDLCVSYTHPVFLEKAGHWLRRVATLLKPYCSQEDGIIIALQLDNETGGIHIWANNDWPDYNRETFGFGTSDGQWPLFLKGRYQSIHRLNDTWGTTFSDFTQALPICRDAHSVGDMRRLKDYEDCYFAQISTYFCWIRAIFRDCGIQLPCIHNSPNPGCNAFYLEAARDLKPDFLLGSDHYYNLNQTWPQNNPTPQYAVKCFSSLSILQNMGMPPTVMEMPSGSASDWPPIFPEDEKAAYLTNLAFGMKGWSYYIFTGGPNAPNTGRNTDSYDYHAAIGAGGEIRSLYHVQKEFHRFCIENNLPQSILHTDFLIGYDHTMLRSNSSATYRNPAFFPPGKAWELTNTGIVTTALCCGLTPEYRDLENPIPTGRGPLVLVSSSVLSESAQKNVAQFVLHGGKLLLGPFIPTMDANYKPCTILADALGLSKLLLSEEPNCITDIPNIPNIMTSGPVYALSGMTSASILAQSRKSGHPLALQFSAGQGDIIFIGFGWIHSKDVHCKALLKFLGSLGVHPILRKTENISFAAIHKLPSGSGLLFVMNLFSGKLQTEITVDWNRQRLYFPLALEPMEVRAITLP